MENDRKNTAGHVLTYVVALIVPLGVGGLSALLTRGNMDVYETLDTPPLSPPAILFPIVWTALYALMGVSSALAYQNLGKDGKDGRAGLRIYALSLVFNFFWSILFFNARACLFSFSWLLVLLALIVLTIVKYQRVSPAAAYLQIPYAVWVAFAGYLNFGIWFLNR